MWISWHGDISGVVSPSLDALRVLFCCFGAFFGVRTAVFSGYNGLAVGGICFLVQPTSSSSSSSASSSSRRFYSSMTAYIKLIWSQSYAPFFCFLGRWAESVSAFLANSKKGGGCFAHFFLDNYIKIWHLHHLAFKSGLKVDHEASFRVFFVIFPLINMPFLFEFFKKEASFFFL